jgi:hypothetical protein
MRTMKRSAPPSEAVVATSLRSALPEFLAGAPEEHELRKYLVDNAAIDRCPALQMVA